MGKRFINSLKCVLTEKEKIERGQSMARELELCDAAEAEKKEVTDSLSKEIKRHYGSASYLGQVIRQGFEYREVECEEERDYAKGVVRIVRLDTGAIEQEREMTPEERQASLI